MGLIKAALGSAGGVLADQWKEYFYCEALPENVMAVKGQKRTSGRSSNTKGSDNIISNGSVIAVADGQCMLIVDQGKIVDMCAVPGEYTYDQSTEPSIFVGDLGEGIKNVFNNMANRFTFGGEAPKDQRVYYFNTKELIGNKYGTANPVPFRVVDQRAGIDIDVGIRCFGEYSYRICNPALFYTNVCGNVAEAYTRDKLDGQLKTELLTALQPAFAKIGEDGIRYSQLPGHTMELADALNEVLSKKWRDLRGIEIVSFGVSSVTADEEDEKMLKELQRNAAFMDPTRAAAHLVGAQASAMQAAANNQNAGPAMACMGLNMAGQAGGGNAQSRYQMVAQQLAAPAAAGWTCACGQSGITGKFCPNCGKPKPAPAPAAGSWTCSCGATATGKFCPECGSKKPEPKPAADSWTCSCDATVTGKFCPECGKPRPAAAEGWTCSCGAVNKGKFCSECGKPKPAGTPKYKCDKCGWEPEDPANPPKFCPECADPSDAPDIK